MSSRIAVMWLASLLLAPSLPARPVRTAPLGVVTQSSLARFNSSKVTPGATVYDGDVLATDAEGTLQLRSGATLLYLQGNSSILLHGSPDRAQALLRMGTVVFSTAKAAALEVMADGAIIRPLTDGTIIAQVTLVGPKELQVAARRGALELSYHGDIEKIPEGASYRILLDSAEPAATPFPQKGPPSISRDNRKVKIVALVLVGWLTEWAVHEALESPDRP